MSVPMLPRSLSPAFPSNIYLVRSVEFWLNFRSMRLPSLFGLYMDPTVYFGGSFVSKLISHDVNFPLRTKCFSHLPTFFLHKVLIHLILEYNGHLSDGASKNAPCLLDKVQRNPVPSGFPPHLKAAVAYSSRNSWFTISCPSILFWFLLFRTLFWNSFSHDCFSNDAGHFYRVSILRWATFYSSRPSFCGLQTPEHPYPSVFQISISFPVQAYPEAYHTHLA